jgi:hypothetical protein
MLGRPIKWRRDGALIFRFGADGGWMVGQFFIFFASGWWAEGMERDEMRWDDRGWWVHGFYFFAVHGV